VGGIIFLYVIWVAITVVMVLTAVLFNRQH